MATGYVAGRKMTQHGQAAEARQSWKTLAMGEEPRKYCMAFPFKGGPQRYPAEGCEDQAATRTAMGVHFLYWRVLDTVVILEEVNLPYQQCNRCNILVP